MLPEPSAAPRAPRPPRPLTGWMVLAMLTGFFGVVFAVNAVLVREALGTMPGTDAHNGYEESQRYNGEIARARRQESAGWHATVAPRLKGGVTALTVSLTDHAGVPVSDVTVAARLRHPADRRADREAALAARGGGLFTGSIAGVQPGNWELTVTAWRGGKRLYESRNRLLLED